MDISSQTAPAVLKRRWPGVLLSFFVPGFGLLRANHAGRAIVWFLSLYAGTLICALLLNWRAVPTSICSLATVLVWGAFITMLVDSFRPGRLTLIRLLVFVLVLTAIAIL